MGRARKVIKAYKQYKDVCTLTTLCDVCGSKEDCPVYTLFLETKKAAWKHHRHSIRFDLPECSEFEPIKEARHFPIE